MEDARTRLQFGKRPELTGTQSRLFIACVRLLIRLLLVLSHDDADEMRIKMETKGTISPLAQL